MVSSERGYCADAAGVYNYKFFPVTMRIAPTSLQSGGTPGNAAASTGATAITTAGYVYKLVPTAFPANVTVDGFTLTFSAEL